MHSCRQIIFLFFSCTIQSQLYQLNLIRSEQKLNCRIQASVVSGFITPRVSFRSIWIETGRSMWRSSLLLDLLYQSETCTLLLLNFVFSHPGFLRVPAECDRNGRYEDSRWDRTSGFSFYILYALVVVTSLIFPSVVSEQRDQMSTFSPD